MLYKEQFLKQPHLLRLLSLTKTCMFSQFLTTKDVVNLSVCQRRFEILIIWNIFQRKILHYITLSCLNGAYIAMYSNVIQAQNDSHAVSMECDLSL